MALSTNLVAYWKLDEASGNAADATGNGNTLTNNGSASFAASLINNGIDLGSSNSTKYLSSSSDLGAIGSGSYSVSFWVKLDTEIGSGTYYFWEQNTNSPLTVDSSIAYLYNGGTRQLRFLRSKAAVADNQFTYNTTLGTSAWHHIVMTYDGSTVTGYVDGSSVGTVASSGAGNFNFPNGTTFGVANDSTRYASTKMDEMALWSRALTSAEVTSLYNSGAGKAYPFGTTYTSTLTETPSFTDTLIKATTKLLTEAKTYTDTFSRIWTLGRTLTETVTNTATLIKTAGRTLLEAVTNTDFFTSGTTVTSAGPYFPASTSNVTFQSHGAWQNPTNAASTDATYTTSALAGNFNSDILRATNFGFNIPSAANIVGISADLIGHYTASGVVGSKGHNIVYFLKASSEVGINNTGVGFFPANADGTVTIGSPTSLSGTSWTPAEINNVGFGLDYGWFANPTSGTDTLFIDSIAITVYYIPTGNQWTKTLTDAVTVADTVLRTTTKLLSEVVTYADSAIRIITRALIETVTLLDTVLTGTERTLAETFASSDIFIGLRTKAATLTESVTYTITFIRSVVRTFTESVTYTATFTGFKATIGGFFDSFTSTDTVIKSPTKVLSEAVTYLDSLIRSITKLLTESSTMADTVSNARLRVSNLTEAFGSLDSVIRATTRSLIESVTYSDVFSSTKVFFRTLSESATFTATLVRSALKNLVETVASSDTFTRVLTAVRVFTESVTYSAVFRFLKNGSDTLWLNVSKHAASLTNTVKHVASLSTVAKHISAWRNKDKS